MNIFQFGSQSCIRRWEQLYASLNALQDLKMAYPNTTEKRRLELQAIGKQLTKEK